MQSEPRRREEGPGTSRERKAIHRKMKRTNVWKTNIKTMGRKVNQQTFLGSSLPTTASDHYAIVFYGDHSLSGADPLNKFFHTVRGKIKVCF